MPIKLIDPRPGKTPYYTGRGTHRGVYVERSTKFTSKQKAKECIAGWERQIERGEYDRKPTEPVAGPKREATFADAALAYLRADGEVNYIGAIVEYEGEYAIRDKLVRDIDQIMIDNCANAIYPDAPAATRNRNN